MKNREIIENKGNIDQGNEETEKIKFSIEVPAYALRAYALFFARHGVRGEFMQSELNWLVRQSMKKKIFALLLKSGWIEKRGRKKYVCVNPNEIIVNLLSFRVPNLMKKAESNYAFTGLSAIEIWSDYSYIQRGMEKSPYFIKVLKQDLRYWKEFFNKNNIPNYVDSGSTIGEYVILMPCNKLNYEEKDGYKVENVKETLKLAGSNEIYSYAYNYIRNKYFNNKE